MIFETPDDILPEDYLDENAVYGKQRGRMIPIDRIMQKLDEYLSHNDTAAAERHLNFWRAEALRLGDLRGLFSVRDEQMGLFRKLGKKEEALNAAKETLEIAENIGLGGTVAYATALLNAATVDKAFGMANEAISLYEEAEELYFRLLPPSDKRLGGLYNNYALALAEVGRIEEAIVKNEVAIEIMTAAKSYPEAAISYLNLADCLEMKYGMEEGEQLLTNVLDKAEELLFLNENDGNYAYVCEKCAGSFDYFGRFFAAMECRERAKKIYERT